ncbi:phosphatase [Clostridium polyendosporum]|uniref:Phosphatase n=1 Tax=Clostridium polyendosporum TaxID=69208 RepID=A0A919S0I9_9CLOT|nr:PHP domain-containing protein [Clostridium polyendosporum]GIM29587.1 phosphatase [Clostridium polyendosporum]
MNTKYINVEFHCHTNASDGTFSPSEVVENAKKKNLEILAITDHDTIDGLDEALKKATELNIRLIPGIELSCTHNGESIHILGYFRDDSYNSNELKDFLKELKNSRIERAKKIVENLAKYFDIHLDCNAVLEKGEGVVARPHIAQSIIEAGYSYSWEYIFDKIIGNDSPAYIPYKKISVSEGISLLKKYNAVVILAHPKLIKKTPVEDFLNFDFDGLEAIYIQNFKKDTDYLISLCRRNNLLITCGSDFHGVHEGDAKHGDLGTMSIPVEDLNKFLDFYNIKV